MSFQADRDQVIEQTATQESWQTFYEWLVDNDIPYHISCPREKMAIVMYCHFLNLQKRRDADSLDKATFFRRLLYSRGFSFDDDGRGLINTVENNRQVRIPDSLRMFEEHSDGSDAGGTGEVGSGLVTPSPNPTDPVSGVPGSGGTDSNQGVPVPVRRKNR